MYAILLLAIFCYANASPALTGCVYTSWYSEEDGPPYDMILGYPMVGLGCSGDYCDSMQAQQCTTIINGGDELVLESTNCEELSSPFSDEIYDGEMCPDGKFVQSMRCEGRYCDNIYLTCCSPNGWTVDFSQKTDTEWFSDDFSSPQQCPALFVVIGGSASNRYADNMVLHCAPIYVTPAAGPTSGSWFAVCSSNVPDNPCTYTQTESITRQRQHTWDDSFTSSADASVSAKILFLGADVSLQTSVTNSVEELIGLEVDTTRTCSTPSHLKSSDSEIVWWQFELDIDDICIMDPDGTSHKMHITTCYFLLTDGFDLNPKCTPGYCADEQCQTCTT